MKTNILVIGTGISGLSYAIKVATRAPQHQITVIAKDKLNETNTQYAQGGIAVVMNDALDCHEKHIADTLTAGGGLCDIHVVRGVVEEAKERIEELQQWGVVFDTNKENKLHLIREGGHSEKRIVHHKDETGKAVQDALLEKALTFPNIKLLANHILVDLITEHHLPQNTRRCYGAYVISKTHQKVITIASDLTILSTGGGGQLFANTSNPKGATADGLGAAYRAKVLIKQLPYVQFHPTVLYAPNTIQPLLLSEALRGAGALLRNADGALFMEKYHPKKELAPRDVVARSSAIEIAKGHLPHVYLDCSPIPEKDFKTQFPFLFQSCRDKNIEVPMQWIPVLPAAHYFCGGIAVDSSGQTALPHLFAIGECSCTGLHGANRLASNALLESIVYAHRAATKSILLLKTTSEQVPQLPEWDGGKYYTQKTTNETQQLRAQLQNTMTKYMGLFKHTQGMIQAKKEVLQMYYEVQKIYNKAQLTSAFCELRNMIGVAYLMVEQALQIKQNNGTFYNQDYAE